MRKHIVVAFVVVIVVVVLTAVVVVLYNSCFLCSCPMAELIFIVVIYT